MIRIGGKRKPNPIQWLCILFALAFLGCSSTTVVRPGQNHFVKERGVLLTTNGEKLPLRHALVQGETISGIDARADYKIKVPMAGAQKLVVKNRGMGALQGMLVFAGLGAVLGAIPDPDCGDPCLFPNGGIGGSVFYAAMAAPVGAIWGAVLGSNRNYVFEHSSPNADSLSNTEGKTTH